jgi:hypothetical protein
MKSSLMLCLMLCLAGCSSIASKPSTEIQQQAAGLTSFARLETKQTETLTAIAEVKTAVEALATTTRETQLSLDTLKASLPSAGPVSKEVITSKAEGAKELKDSGSSLPSAFRVASDGTILRWSIAGDWNPSILKTSQHLREQHGVNTDGMTHQQMADLHADLSEGRTGGRTVSGSIFQNSGTSQVVRQSVPVRTVSRRRGLFQWSTGNTRSTCFSGRCN